MSGFSRGLRRGVSFKVFKKANTYIIPTVSWAEHAIEVSDFVLPSFLNLAHSAHYSHLASKDVRQLTASDYFDRFALQKVIMDITPNAEDFLANLRMLEQACIVYLNIQSQDYLTLCKLVEESNKFPNVIVSVHDRSLSESELIAIYTEIKPPVYLALDTANSVNFADTPKETQMRRFLKEMFRFSSSVKVVELDASGFDRMCAMAKLESTEVNGKKHSSLKTLIDFCLVSEFKGFWNVSLAGYDQPGGVDRLADNFQLLQEVLEKKGFNLHKMDREEVFQVVHNIQPNRNFLAYNE